LYNSKPLNYLIALILSLVTTSLKSNQTSYNQLMLYGLPVSKKQGVNSSTLLLMIV